MKQSSLTTYLKLCTEHYDLEDHPHDARARAFYMNYALQAHGPILEPMCGTGRFLIPLVEACLDVEGFDASPYMLEALKQKFSEAPVWQDFVQNFKRDKKYHLIFVPYGSWGLMSDVQDSKRGLEIMYNHLAPGGKLVIDIETVASAPKTLNIWHRGISVRADGSYIALNTYPTYNNDTQIFRAVCRYESIRNGMIESSETEDFSMYLYHFDEFEQYLIQAGFSQIVKYQDYDKNKAHDTQTPLLIYECIR